MSLIKRRVLVPTDFSEHSQIATLRAIGFAKKKGTNNNIIYCKKGYFEKILAKALHTR